MKTPEFFVVVYEAQKNAQPKEIHRIGPMDERKAERVDNGMNINLDHERCFTRIEPATPKKPTPK